MPNYLLKRDAESCNDCGACDIILTGFRNVNNGCIQISEGNYSKEHVKDAIDKIIKICPAEAISLVSNSSADS